MLLSVLRPVLVGLLICAALGSLASACCLLAGIPAGYWSALAPAGPFLLVGLVRITF